MRWVHAHPTNQDRNMPQLDIKHLQALDAAHHLHPFNDNAALAKQGTRILTHGKGVYVWDADGNQLLDAFAGLWCVNIGYGRKELGEVAARQMTQLAYYNSFFQCTTEPTIRLAAKLAELVPGDLNHRSEEHTSELQSLMRISYAVFCLKKKNTKLTSTSDTSPII